MSKDTITTTTVNFQWMSLLAEVLVVLKVTGKITLAWKWVLAPIWMPIVLTVGFLGILAAVAFLAALVVAIADRN